MKKKIKTIFNGWFKIYCEIKEGLREFSARIDFMAEYYTLRHSLRLNADVAARAWVFLGSLIVGEKFILRSLIHD